MVDESPRTDTLEVVAVDETRWADLQTLFGPNGAFAGCWCAYWRLRHAEFEKTPAADHKALLHRRACSETPPGLLAYHEGTPVGWLSIEPRENFRALSFARVYTPVDETPVWTVTCFYVHEDYRGRGIPTALLEAAHSHVKAHGGVAIEGYPQDPATDLGSITPGYMGLIPSFEAAGFTEIARLSNGRPVYRRTVD